jgi:hypothetical protein
MIKKCFMLTLVMLMTAGAVAQETWVVNDRLLIQLRGWWTDFDAQTSLVRGWFGGKIDLDDALNLDREWTPEVSLRWQFKPRHAVQLRYNYLQFDGSEFLTRGVTIDRQVIPLFAQLEADVDMHFLRLDWRRKWFMDKSDSFDFETSLGVLGFDVQGKYQAYFPGFGWIGGLGPFSRGVWQRLVDAALPNYLDFLNAALYREDKEDITAALPVLGVGFDWQATRRLSLGAEISGMYAGSYGQFFDAEASLAFAITPWFDINGGYRYWRVDADDGDDDYRVVMSGPFVGGTIRF